MDKREDKIGKWKRKLKNWQKLHYILRIWSQYFLYSELKLKVFFMTKVFNKDFIIMFCEDTGTFY